MGRACGIAHSVHDPRRPLKKVGGGRPPRRKKEAGEAVVTPKRGRGRPPGHNIETVKAVLPIQRAILPKRGRGPPSQEGGKRTFSEAYTWKLERLFSLTRKP